MNALLQKLLNRPDVWQSSRRGMGGGTTDVVPSGHPALDGVLHLGGWPRGALTEVLGSDIGGIGEMQLLLPTLARCSRTARRLFLVCPPYLPYAPALLAQGVDTGKVLLLTARHGRDAFWSAEQVLGSRASSCLLAWLPEPRLADYRHLRRLQLAAQDSGSLVFLFRPSGSASALSPASLRLLLEPAARELRLTILKQRGGQAGQCVALSRPGELLQERIVTTMLPVSVSGRSATVDADDEMPSRRHWTRPPATTAAALH